MGSSRIKIALFTDTATCLAHEGTKYYAVRDQYINFISKLQQYTKLIVLSRCNICGNSVDNGEEINYGENFEFVPLRYYKNTEDFYRNIIHVVKESYRVVDTYISESDVIVLRIHHALAPLIFYLSKRHKIPVALYWAGPPIMESAKINYPGKTLKDISARIIANFEFHIHRYIAKRAQWNFFLDSNEYDLMDKPKKTSWVVPNLITGDMITDQPKSRGFNETMRVIFASRLYRHKGIFDLVRCAKLLEGENIEFYIAGTGPDEEELAGLIEKEELLDKVHLLGNLRHDDLQRELRESHVFVLPSYAEGIPKILWEAWAAGLVPIITDVGSVSRFVKSNANGYLVAPGDISTFTACIEECLHDDDKRCAIAKCGIEEVANHMWEKQIRNMYLTLDNVVSTFSLRK